MSGMESDPEGDRQRRLEALRNLAQQDPATEATSARTPLTEALPASIKGGQPRARRRWLLPLSAGILIVALAAAGVARFALGLRGSGTAIHSNTLTLHVITLPASAALYCPSSPVWSPDGKHIAVMAQTAPPDQQSGCAFYQDIVHLESSTSTGSGSVSDFAVAELDVSTGALIHQFTLPDPFKTLCVGIGNCSAEIFPPVSLSWSPDGAYIGVYADETVSYPGPSSVELFQERAALYLMRADGVGPVRGLVAKGRIHVPTNNIQSSSLYSPPLFEWNLTNGDGSFTDIHEAAGIYTIPYATAYQMDVRGRISALAVSAHGAITPWSYGVLNVGTDTPLVTFDSSQWAWSADARYVIPNLDTGAYLKLLPLTATPGLEIQGFYNPPFIVPPDAATAALVRELALSRIGAYVARDPGGARLASFMCEQDSGIGKLTLRTTASGKTLATVEYQFPPVAASLGCPGDAEAIDWSPDGSRIAMTDIQDDQIVLWQVSAGA